MEIKTVQLKEYSSLKIGGQGKLVIVSSLPELTEVYLYAKENSLRVCIIGEGTNTFFDEVLAGILFIKIQIQGIEIEDHDNESAVLTAYTGENWDTVVAYAVSRNLWGIENLSYIPGTVGAAPVQNIGAYGVELKDTFCSLYAYDIITNTFVTLGHDECQFSYRDSIFKKNKERYCIISVKIFLSKKRNPVLSYSPLNTLSEDCTLTTIRKTVIDVRKSKLPDYNIYPNCGSFFKNPIISIDQKNELSKNFPSMPFISHNDGYKIPAAWLIEHIANMKGLRLGDLGTWPKQPLVLVNYGDSTARDVDAFIATIIAKVYKQTKIILEQEVNRVG